MDKLSPRETNRILDQAKRVLKIEAEAVSSLGPNLNREFVHAVQLILRCKGRVIVSAIGKSGHIGKKITSTLASVGTPASFMHPSEAFHGDLGMITQKDVLLILSNSGESVVWLMGTALSPFGNFFVLFKKIRCT